ncbi:MAG: YcnI family protein [Micromonosporaceae bacterium]
MIRRLSGGVLAAALAGALAGGFGFTGPASAHVTVEPKEAAQGGFATVVFRMPNERDDAATTKLEVVMPTEHPIASVRTMDVPGWDITVKKRTLDKPIEAFGRKVDEVVDTITWTATKGHALGNLEFVQFPVSMGRLPETDQLVFKALQTYDSGEVVRWIEETKEGEEDPENPAPVLKLAKPPAEGAGTDDPAPAAAEKNSSGGGTPMWLGMVGLLAGLGGLTLGGLAYQRTRTSAETGDGSGGQERAS